MVCPRLNCNSSNRSDSSRITNGTKVIAKLDVKLITTRNWLSSFGVEKDLATSNTSAHSVARGSLDSLGEPSAVDLHGDLANNLELSSARELDQVVQWTGQDSWFCHRQNHSILQWLNHNSHEKQVSTSNPIYEMKEIGSSNDYIPTHHGSFMQLEIFNVFPWKSLGMNAPDYYSKDNVLQILHRSGLCGNICSVRAIHQ